MDVVESKLESKVEDASKLETVQEEDDKDVAVVDDKVSSPQVERDQKLGAIQEEDAEGKPKEGEEGQGSIAAEPEKKKKPVRKGGADLRQHFRRGNTVASTNPLDFQEFSIQMLDKEREKLNAQNSNNNTDQSSTTNAQKSRGETVERQIKSVPAPEKTPLSYSDLFKDDKPDYIKLKEHLIREGRLEMDAAKALIQKAGDLFREQANLIELEAPYTVCGDIHGQFYDLINLLENAGDPKDTPYLFLGDYVDRGCFSCEVTFLLYAMKINFPSTFHLIRGNHESRAMTNIHNFKVECLKKYGQELYDLFMSSFDCLPLAAVLKCRMLGRFFCVHGGLSPNIETLDDIQVLNRFEEVPSDGAITDLLWSDPILEDDEMTPRDILEFRELEYADNVERGIGYFFGFKAITDFLLKNNLVSVVRAHEVQQEGCTEHMFTRTDLSIPMAFTVFSAPNYCDFYSNKAAYIKFSHNKYEVYQLEYVPHPYWLPDFQNVFAFSIEYVFDSIHTVLKNLVVHTDEGEEEEPVDWGSESRSDYLKRLTSLQAKIKTPRAAIDDNLSPEEKFKKAREMDSKFERKSPVLPTVLRKKDVKSRVLKRNVSSYF